VAYSTISWIAKSNHVSNQPRDNSIDSMRHPMDSPELPPTSNQDGGSTYGTPEDHPDTSSPVMKSSEKDPQLVVGAGRSLKNMFVDLMALLETQAKAQVFIQGDITLRVEGRESYTISLFNPDGVEPSDLKVRMDKSSDLESGPVFPNGISANDVNASRKRQREDNQADGWKDTETTPKRKRVDSENDGDASQHTLQNRQREASTTLAANVDTKLQNISAQIKWVEECRRIADEAHDKREETWRTTSATFHDEARKARERHDTWVASEMSWQRNILVGMMNDLKGLYPLGHSLKWGM
jgi:hypothetical protein